MPSILSQINWTEVEERVAAETQRREYHSPAISVFRWWARRPHSLIRAVLESAWAQGVRHVADPFSGGGTVALEAAGLGMKVYAQDLYPWPVFGLQTALRPVDPIRLRSEGEKLLGHLEPLRGHYRRSDGTELLGILRVRTLRCNTCESVFPYYPNGILSKVRRKGGDAYYGCRACGEVGQAATCPCGYTPGYDPPGRVVCPHCKATGEVRAMQVGWHSPLVLEERDMKVLLRPPVEGDPVEFIPASRALPGLRQEIGPGVETRKLLRGVVRHWGDLYSEGQARIVLEGLAYLRARRMPVAIRDRLAMAVLGLGEMAALLARWDRLYCKAIEGIANHHYSSAQVAVELNPLSKIGRGVLRRRLEMAYSAADWRAGLTNQVEARVVSGSSERQHLGKNAVDLVLTDPPYFDDVQYGELARILHFWLALYRPQTVDEARELAPNSVRGVDAVAYTQRLSAIFKESMRSLRPGGRVVMSFHNLELRAWEALAAALRGTDLRLKALAVSRAENPNDHSKRGKNTQLHDAILEFERGYRGRPGIYGVVSGASSKNLLAAGRALGKAASGADFRRAYFTHCRALGVEPVIR